MLAGGLGQCVAAAVGRASMYKERSVSTRLGCLLLVHAMRRGGLHILTVATSVDLRSRPIVLRRFDVWPFAAVGHSRMTGGHRVLLYDDGVIIIIIIMALR